jgi:hypothetical protein
VEHFRILFDHAMNVHLGNSLLSTAIGNDGRIGMAIIGIRLRPRS